MRFVMFMIPAVYNDPDAAPRTPGREDVEAIEAMGRYNDELSKSGALLGADGLHPLSAGARVSYAGGTPTVTDGPFTEAKEVVGGYWMIQVRDKEEAIEWAKRIPAAEGDIVEVRQVFEMSDFPQDVQDAAGELSQAPPEQTSAR